MSEWGATYPVTSFSVNGVTEWYPLINEVVVFPIATYWECAPEQATFSVSETYATFTVSEDAIDELTAAAQQENRSVLDLIVDDAKEMEHHRFDGIADWYPVFLKSLDEPEIDWSHFDGYPVAGSQDSLSKFIQGVSEDRWASRIEESLDE